MPRTLCGSLKKTRTSSSPSFRPLERNLPRSRDGSSRFPLLIVLVFTLPAALPPALSRHQGFSLFTTPHFSSLLPFFLDFLYYAEYLEWGAVKANGGALKRTARVLCLALPEWRRTREICSRWWGAVGGGRRGACRPRRGRRARGEPAEGR